MVIAIEITVGRGGETHNTIKKQKGDIQNDGAKLGKVS